MTDPWGTPSNQNQQQAQPAVRSNRSLKGIIITLVGVAFIVGFGLYKISQPAVSGVATPEMGAIDFGPIESWLPLLGVVIGFVIVYIGIKTINRGRGRKGLQ